MKGKIDMIAQKIHSHLIKQSIKSKGLVEQMIKPLVRIIEECKPNDKSTIFFPEECETISANVVSVPSGQSVDPSSHPDEEEVYIIIKGRGTVRLNDEKFEVSAGTMVYIPRDTIHAVTGLSEEDFEFVCVANWPDKIPPKQ